MWEVDLREIMVEVDKSFSILKDNVTVQVEGVAYIRVNDSYQVVYDVSDFLDVIRQKCQSALRTALGRLTLSELFGNRTSVSQNVESSLNQFFEENQNCAELKRFELTEINPIGIDLTKESIAQREKIRQIIISEAEK